MAGNDDVAHWVDVQERIVMSVPELELRPGYRALIDGSPTGETTYGHAAPQAPLAALPAAPATPSEKAAMWGAETGRPPIRSAARSASTPSASTPSGSTPSGSARSASAPSGSASVGSGLGRGRLGAGLVQVPPVVVSDPMSALGYIVMEYVGGQTLEDVLGARRRVDGSIEPLPAAHAIAYALEILLALAYLHERGLVYCDLKPANVIQHGRQLKLIDLGAVLRMGDRTSSVYGTVGYQAPEIATAGPSVSSDLYTLGRTLAVLALGVPASLAGLPQELPEPADHPLLLRVVRAHLDAGDVPAAEAAIDELDSEPVGDWRLTWYRGVAALVDDRADAACVAFDDVYSMLAGEVAPKLALAAAAECGGFDHRAGHFYVLVTLSDPHLVDAVFGLARVRLRAGDRAGAIAALDGCAETSSRYVTAQLAAVQAAFLGRTGRAVGEDELRAAAARAEQLQLDPATDVGVRAALLAVAVELAEAQPAGVAMPAPLLGTDWRAHDLRLALERCLRTAARLRADVGERIALIDRANLAHPPTWM